MSFPDNMSHYVRDRFIPSRAQFEQFGGMESVMVKTPETTPEKILFRTIFHDLDPNSSRLNPQKRTEPIVSRKEGWQIPNSRNPMSAWVASGALLHPYTRKVSGCQSGEIAFSLEKQSYVRSMSGKFELLGELSENILTTSLSKNGVFCVLSDPSGMHIFGGGRLFEKVSVVATQLFSNADPLDRLSYTAIEWKSDQVFYYNLNGNVAQKDLRVKDHMPVTENVGGGATHLRYMSDGESLAIGKRNGEVKIYDLRQQRMRTQFSTEKAIRGLHWIGGKQSVGVANEEGLTVVKLNQSGLRDRIIERDDLMTDVICTSDAIVTAHESGKLSIFDPQTYYKLHEYSEHTGEVNHLCSIPLYDRVVSMSIEDECVMVWEIAKRIKTKSAPTNRSLFGTFNSLGLR